ncbi:outer membrane protein assembly factor BamB family protein [Streptosporangium sp. H16]|uniref:outer membrane protein assembly factor BamB family protein n=1 Tax=Streptosporangium sp. H16 TaxID=3444184 RepID=UPI003F793990
MLTGPWRGGGRAAILTVLVLLVAVPRSALPSGDPARTGFSEVWSLEAPGPLDGSAVRLSGGDLLVPTRTALRVHDPATGAERWRYAPAGAAVREWAPAGPAVVAETRRPTPSGDVTALTGLSRRTGAVLWHREELGLGAPMSARAGAEETPPVGLARDPVSRALLGLDPATGRTRWTLPLPPSCDRMIAAGSGARTAVIATRCGNGIRVSALDPAGGAERWSTRITSFSALYVGGGTVVVSRPERLTVHDAATGRVITERGDCWDGCVPVHAGGRIVVASDQDGASAVEGIDLTRGSAAWRWAQPNGPRYDRLVPLGAAVYATPYGDDLGRVLDVIQAPTGLLRRTMIPAAGPLFGADRDRLYFVRTVRPAALPARLRVTALRVPDRFTGSSLAAEPATVPVAAPGADLCGPLRAAGFTVLGRARYRRAVPPFTACEFGEARGEPMTAEFWRLATEAEAARVLTELGAESGGMSVPGVGDEARLLDDRGRAVVVRTGRDLLRIRSPYLTARDRLVPVARALAGRLGALRWAVPASWSPPVEYGVTPAGRIRRLPGTRFQVRDAPGSPLSLTAYQLGKDGPAYLGNGDGFTVRRERVKAVSQDGRWAVSDFRDYVDGRDGVVLLDRRGGGVRRIATVRRPWSNTAPVWSPDGRVLLTLWHTDERDYSTARGFVVVDPARGTVEVTLTGDDQPHEPPYRWSADGTGVSGHFGLGDLYTDLGEGYDSYELRTFGTDGAPLSAARGLGRPDGEILDPYSPSGRRLAGWCPDRPRDLCVHDAATGAALVRIETNMRYPIRWYDEHHLLVWRRHGEGHAASVMDLHGRILTDLARDGLAGRSEMKLFYTPLPR